MQQVRQSSAAIPAFLTDARRTPVAQKGARSRLLVGLHHKWVLHRKWFIRAIAGFACASLIAAGFHARGGIMQSMDVLGQVMSGKFASTGFGVNAIDISGQSITSEREILSALAIDVGQTSTLNFDAEAARQRIEALPAIASAEVRKIYPGRLIVTVTERQPVARWRVNDKTYLVDAGGAKLGFAAERDAGLPLVIGEGASDDALPLIKALEQNTVLDKGLVALSRIADRRWDLIYDTGLRVQLPELGVRQALNLLGRYQQDYQILDRDLSVIDLRVDGEVAVRLAKHEDAEADGKGT